MAFIEFQQLPDTARLWIYAARRAFDKSQVDTLKDHMNRFMQEWTAHKRELRTGWELKYDQFILVAVDEQTMAASGCSIDSMVHSLQEFEKNVGCQVIGTSTLVFYRNEVGDIRSVDRAQFKHLTELGKVNENTIVFNNVIDALKTFREGKWEVPMRESWHMQAFGAVQK